jgi:TonB family protein
VRRILGSIIGALALSAAPPAQAQAPGPDGWELRQTPESCYLLRSFATPAGKMDLRIQAFGGTTPYHVILHGPGLPVRDNSLELGAVAFGDDEAEQTVFFVGQTGGVPTAVFPAFFRQANLMGVFFRGSGASQYLGLDKSAERLSVDLPDGEPLSLDLGPMADAYARLDACAQGLVDGWSRAVSGSAVPVSAPELLDPAGVNRRVWFPPNLSMNRISGMVELRMTVGKDGKARGCVAQVSVGSAQFGEDACEALERWARFAPARDAEGNAVDALYQTAITFMIYRW